LDLLDFAHGGGLNLSHAVNALVSAISATEESGVAFDAALTLARIEAKIAISPSKMIPLVTEAGASTFWAVWANDRAKAGALRGAAPVSAEDIHDLVDELTALAISQSKQQQSRAQAIAAGQAAGAQEAPHDDTAARVNNVSALSSGSELCSTAGCGKTIRSFFGFCKAGHIQPVFLQCRECKLLVQSAQQHCPRALTHGYQGQPPFLPAPAADAARMSATVKRMWQDLADKRSSSVVALATPTIGSSWGQGSAGSPADWGFPGFRRSGPARRDGGRGRRCSARPPVNDPRRGAHKSLRPHGGKAHLEARARP
jgi:hypothetical protein